MSRAAVAWPAAGLLAAVLLPWYALQDGLGSGAWMAGLWSDEATAGGLAQAVVHGKWWLAPALVALAGCLVVSLLPMRAERRGAWLLAASGAGAASRFSIGIVIVAGMSIGTLFTLFVLPMVYTVLAKDHRAAATGIRATIFAALRGG